MPSSSLFDDPLNISWNQSEEQLYIQISRMTLIIIFKLNFRLSRAFHVNKSSSPVPHQTMNHVDNAENIITNNISRPCHGNQSLLQWIVGGWMSSGVWLYYKGSVGVRCVHFGHSRKIMEILYYLFRAYFIIILLITSTVPKATRHYFSATRQEPTTRPPSGFCAPNKCILPSNSHGSHI